MSRQCAKVYSYNAKNQRKRRLDLNTSLANFLEIGYTRSKKMHNLCEGITGNERSVRYVYRIYRSGP